VSDRQAEEELKETGASPEKDDNEPSRHQGKDGGTLRKVLDKVEEAAGHEDEVGHL
jgi:hypothetical protein